MYPGNIILILVCLLITRTFPSIDFREEKEYTREMLGIRSNVTDTITSCVFRFQGDRRIPVRIMETGVYLMQMTKC